MSISIPVSPYGPASIGLHDQRDEDDRDAYTLGKGLPDRRGIRLVKQKPTHCADNQRDQLMLGKHAQIIGHVACRHERATGVRKRVLACARRYIGPFCL
jgi:hypothetical protein